MESVHNELHAIASELSLPKTIEGDSEKICDEMVEKRLAVGKPVRVLAASSLYAACRVNHTPVTIRELAVASGSNPKEIGGCYRSIVGGMNLTPPNLNGGSYVLKIAARVSASAEATRLALEIVRMATEGGLGDRNPMTLAAAAVYTACLSRGESRTQADLADAAGVSEASVRDCAKAIRLLNARRGEACQRRIGDEAAVHGNFFGEK